MQRVWRTVRVFLSSTFRDMHAERDHLVKAVFPKLRAWCAQRQLHLVDIDLRWGVTQEQAENNKVLEICLQEIDGSRPFFLCMLGDRYGWIPNPVPPEVDYLTREALGTPVRSYTHMEIEHALDPIAHRDKGRPERAAHAFFYLRDPAATPPAESLGALTPQQRAVYSATFFEQNANAAAALAALKQEIQQRAPGRVRIYTPRLDPTAANPEDAALTGRLIGLEAFGQAIYQDLVGAIGIEFEEHIAEAAQTRTAAAAEDWFHDAFAQQRTLTYVPRPDVADALTRLVDEPDRRAIMVAGEPGSGKTTLLAAWSKQRAQRHLDEIVIMRFVGASVSSTSLALLLRGICQEIAEVSGADWTDYQAMAPDPVALSQVWTELAATMAGDRSIVITIDGIDQLEGFGNERWIPNTLPDGFRLITSIALRSAQKLAQLRLERMRELRVPALAPDQREEIIRVLPNLFCKTLAPDQIARLLANKASANPLFLSVALEELRVFGAPRIDGAIAELPQPAGDDIGAAVDALFARVIRRMEREEGRTCAGLTRAVFAALAAARHGLSDGELETIAAHALALSEGDVAEPLQIMLRQLRAYLVRKNSGTASITDFFHASFRRAAAAHFLPDDTQRRAAHALLANFFAGQPNEVESLGGEPQPNVRKAAELPYQYARSGNRAALEALLTDIRFVETKCRADLVMDLQNDYAIAFGAGGAADGDALKRYAAALAAFAAGGAQQQPPSAQAEPSLMGRFRSTFARAPEPAPVSLPPLAPSTERTRAAIRQPESAEPSRLAWFARYVESHHHLLSVHPDYTIALARNAAANGAASQAAESGAAGLLRDPRPLAAPRLLLRRKLVGHTDKVTSLAIAASGAVVVSGSEDSTVRLWDPATGLELARMLGHRGGVFSVAISAAGEVAVSGGEDGALRLWDVASGSMREEWRAHDGAIRAVALSPNGGTVFSVGEDDAMRLWDVEKHAVLGQFPLAPYSDEPFKDASIADLARSHAGDMIRYTAALSADGRLMVISLLNAHYLLHGEQPRGTLRLSRMTGPNEIAAGELPHCILIGLSPDGTAVMHATPPGPEAAESAIMLINPDGSLGRTRGIMPANLRVAAVSDDRRLVAGTRLVSNPNDIRSSRTELCLVDTENAVGRIHDLSRHHRVPVHSFAITPDGSLGLTGGDDGTICAWDLAGQGETLPDGHAGRVYDTAMLPAGGAASFGADGKLHTWSIDGRNQRTLLLDDTHFDRMAVSADGAMIWGIDIWGTFSTIDVAAAKLSTIKFPGTEQSLFLSDIARRQPCAVGAGSVDHKLYLLDARHGAWRFFGDTLRPLSARPAISDNGAVFFTAHVDGTLCRWDISNGSARVLGSLRTPLAAIGMTAGGGALYGIALDGALSVFDPDTGALIAQSLLPATLLRLDSDNIMMNVTEPAAAQLLFPGILAPKTWTVAISDDGQGAIVVAPDDTVRMWAPGASVEVGLYAADQEITAFSSSPDLTRCCVGTADGQLHFLRTRHAERAVPLAHARLGPVRSRTKRAAERIKQRKRADLDLLQGAMTGNPDAELLPILQHALDLPDAGAEQSLSELAEFRIAWQEKVDAPAPAQQPPAAPFDPFEASEASSSDENVALESLGNFLVWLTRFHHRRNYTDYAGAADMWLRHGGGKRVIGTRYEVFVIFCRMLLERGDLADGLPVRLDENTVVRVPREGAEVPLLDRATFESATQDNR